MNLLIINVDIRQALHASWEPRYTWQCHKFPWQQYVKIGGVLRHFGYGVVALRGSLQTEIRVSTFLLSSKMLCVKAE